MKKIIFIFLGILVLSVSLFFYLKTPFITFKKNLLVEVNSNLKTSALVSNIKFGEIEESELKTSKVGDLEVKVKAKSFLNKEREVKVKIKVVDTKEPEIDMSNPVVVYKDSKDDLKEYIYVTDNSNKVNYSIKGDYDLSQVGTYKLQVEASDNSGNKSVKEFSLQVILKEEEKTITENSKTENKVTSSKSKEESKVTTSKTKVTPKKTKKGYDIETIDGVTYINGILIANKTYSLPKTYGDGLTKETNSAFSKMQEAMKEEGLNIFIKSGFRSYETQVQVYNNWVKLNGKARADTYSARPGHSEHQSGLAIDVNLIDQKFKDTDEFKWLQANAYKYGFILRYPETKQDITGYIYEPWHYRYVGKELAKKLYNGGNWLTLEEYLGIDSKYE